MLLKFKLKNYLFKREKMKRYRIKTKTEKQLNLLQDKQRNHY